MKILFLEIDTERTWALASVGPAFIASYIRMHGHDASMLRVGLEQEIDDIICGIKKESPDIIGFSITTRQWKRAAYIAGKIRKKLDIPTIAGGLHPTFAAESVLESAGFDFISIGEGEEAVCDILTYLERNKDIRAIRQAGIPNIWMMGTERPEIRPPHASINNLPFIARDLLDEMHGIIHMSTMRGCPFPCTFCAGGAINSLYGDRIYIRRRSVENVMKELHNLRKRNSINYVIFLDDTFTVNRSWIEEFCEAYGQEIGTGFSINARAETVDPTLIDMLAQAGCSHIIYGIESGSKRVRKDILNRPGDNKQFIDVFRWTKEAGILATANYMIGIPGETAEDIEQTLALNDVLSPDDFGYSVFYPYPGTSLFQICREKGFLPENYLELPANNRQSILNLPAITKDDIDYYYKIFTDVREKNYLKRYGIALDDEQKALAKKNFKNSAAVG